MTKPAFITADQDTWGFKILFDGPDQQLFDLVIDLINTNTGVNTFMQEMSERRVLHELPEITMSHDYLRNAGLAITPVFCCHDGFTEPVFRDDQEALNRFGIIEKPLYDTNVQLIFLGDNNIVLQSPHCYKNCKVHDLCNVLDEMLRFPSHPLIERIRNASEEHIQHFIEWVSEQATWLQNDYPSPDNLYANIQKALATDNWIGREELLDTFAQFDEEQKIEMSPKT